MGYYSKMNLAMKPDAAETFLKQMGSPGDLNSPLYGAGIDRGDDYVEISWPYEKYGCQDEIAECLSRLPDSEYCYLEENEYGEFVNRGSWWDSGLVTPAILVSFGKDDDPFGQVFGMIRKHLGEDEARKALESFHEKIDCPASPRP